MGGHDSRNPSTETLLFSTAAKNSAKSPRTALGKRRHRPTEKWVDYPEERALGGQDYAGEGAAPAAV